MTQPLLASRTCTAATPFHDLGGTVGKIGTVTATALVPGVSANRRLYTRENIAKAGQRMQQQLAGGGLPILMRTHHAAGDDSTRIVGSWQTAEVDPTSGALRVSGPLADTQAGRDILALTTPDPSGRRFLDSVSIYGSWVGEPRTVEHGGAQVETADDLEVVAVDFTGTPGVSGARIESVKVGENRTGLLFGESTDLHVTPEAKDALTPAPSGSYADPGYQADGKKRYPLDSAAHVRAAWAFINRAQNAKPYTSAQLKRIKAKIKAAAKKYDVTISAETAAADYKRLVETVMPRLGEAYACMSLDNGPANISVNGYTDEPADLPDVAAAAARAALAGLACLDPDEDGDIDLPDGNDDDTSPSTCPNCGADLPDDANFCPNCGAAQPSGESAGDDHEETTVSDTEETKASDTAPPTSETAPAAETTGQPDTQAAPAVPDVNALGTAIATALAPLLAAPAAGTPETASTSQALSEATESTPITESVNAAVSEALKAVKDELREELVATYGPRRRGLIRTAESDGGKPLHEMSEEEFRAYRTEALNQLIPGGTA